MAGRFDLRKSMTAVIALALVALPWSASMVNGEEPSPGYLPFPKSSGAPVDFVPYAPPQASHAHIAPAANSHHLLATSTAPTPAAPKSGLRPLSAVMIDARLPAGGAMPTDTANEKHAPATVGPEWIDTRPWMSYEVDWVASDLKHKPSYFEDINLERYGNSACPALQPVISGARFFASVPLLPYQMTVHRPRECIYMLGYCRPGSPAPNLAYRPPLRLDAAAVQAAAVTGAVFIIP